MEKGDSERLDLVLLVPDKPDSAIWYACHRSCVSKAADGEFYADAIKFVKGDE